MKLFKLFGYMFVYGVVIATMLCCYPPTDIYGYLTVGVCVGGAALLLFMSLYRAAFWVEIANPYIVGGWLSLSLFLFTLLFVTDYGDELYTFFVLAAAALVGLLNLDKPKYVLLQHEPKSAAAFARGMIWGMIAFVVANMALVAAFGQATVAESILRASFVGPLTTQLEEWFGIGIEFLMMLFVVAVPEELMARVFYLRMGSAVTDVFTAGLLTMVAGYAMHAVTRYDIEYGSLVLLVITIVWLIFSIVYMRHGLLGSIAAHAVYNTLIAAEIYGLGYLVLTVVVFLAIAYLVLWLENEPVVF